MEIEAIGIIESIATSGVAALILSIICNYFQWKQNQDERKRTDNANKEIKALYERLAQSYADGAETLDRVEKTVANLAGKIQQQ